MSLLPRCWWMKGLGAGVAAGEGDQPLQGTGADVGGQLVAEQPGPALRCDDLVSHVEYVCRGRLWHGGPLAGGPSEVPGVHEEFERQDGQGKGGGHLTAPDRDRA